MSEEPIVYVSGGKLGDLIHQLSIINEIYLKTDRKGVLYIREAPKAFHFDLVSTYNDTLSLISKQSYIEKYAIWNGENYEIDLSRWRGAHGLLYSGTWQKIFSNEYGINWAGSPWLTFDSHDPQFESKIVICCSDVDFRFPDKINFKKWFADLGLENILFVTNLMTEYENFCSRTGTTVKLYTPSSIEDLVTCINSCSLFIGNLSSPLTFAYALRKNSITILNSNAIDNYHFIGLSLPNNEIMIEYN
jgi:hypothetical protein